MSICHKAYLFDHAGFEAELAGLLYATLDTGEADELRAFIRRHRPRLMNLWDEMPLERDWETNLPAGSGLQEYADLALTKYYDPREDKGLGYGFDAPGSYFDVVPGVKEVSGALIGGYLFGPPGRRLDPGCMGTGLLSRADVGRLLRLMERTEWPPIPAPDDPAFAECYYRPQSPDDVEASLKALTALYRTAWAGDRGLLLTDYNDRGVRHK